VRRKDEKFIEPQITQHTQIKTEVPFVNPDRREGLRPFAPYNQTCFVGRERLSEAKPSRRIQENQARRAVKRIMIKMMIKIKKRISNN